MEQDALVFVVGVIVVPVHQRAGRAGRELHGIHRERAGHVHFAGAGHEAFAHHAHERAGVAAVILLHGGPALDGGGVEGVGLHPLGENHAHLCHLHERLLGHALAGDITFNLSKLGCDRWDGWF